MSQTPTELTPCAAYAEDVQEDTQTPIPGTKHSSQVKAKRSKRDATGDSGHVSSRSTVPNGAQNTSGSSKLLSFMGRISGGAAKKSKETQETHPPRTSSKTASTLKGKGLRVDTKIESREDAARMKLSGEPVQRTTSNRSYETSPPNHPRSAKTSPPSAQAPPLRRPAPPPTRMSMPRPFSYHAEIPGNGVSYHNISFSPIPVYPQSIQPTPQHYQQPQMLPVSSMPSTMAVPRQAAYPFEPTLPPQYFPASAGWESGYQSPTMQPSFSYPAIPRRYSITGPPTHAIVEYPTVPSRTIPRRPQPLYQADSFRNTIVTQDVYVDQNEAYHRRKAEEEARQMMPPPQRPLMRHASTTSAVRRSNRNSREYNPRPGTSSRTESFSSPTEEIRIPLTSREKNIPVHTLESQSPSSPKQLRRSRPMSYHAAVDSEIAAEQYQARQRGFTEPQSLEIHDVERVKKSSKGHKSKTSDTGSKGSNEKKEAKKRSESRQKSGGDGLSVEVVEGCTATFRRNSKGLVVRVSLNEEAKDRNGRALDREEKRDSRRFSASSRRESMSETIARSIAPRRPSSSHPTSRRNRVETTDNEDMNKKLIEKYRMIDDTAVEDDEYSEVERRKKRSEKHEKLTAQRLQRLKPSGESRQSSRSARSNKSTKSVTSSKNGGLVEGRI